MRGLAIFDDLTVLADETRSRMLFVLERHELTVSELCSVLQLPQSTVSRHLKTLSDANWVTSRRDGTSRYYTLAIDEREAPSRRLWSLLRDQVATTSRADQDGRRLKGVLGRRQRKSEEFFASAAGQWDRLRQEMFGSASLAPFVARAIAVDRSGEMLQAARKRLRDFSNVDVRRGELEALPIDDSELDAAVMMLVLHHVPDPSRALAEAARVLKPRGRLVVCDMLPHDREEYKQQMGHVWLGFGDDQIRRLLAGAGFSAPRIVALPTDASAKGPALFAASASRS
jgi:DNA-binding transcriptional ArsR family regulator